MIPQDTVAKILDAARIEDVIGDFVTLKRSGANFMACCPFHNEKTPSFVVSPAKGIYKCFGCGKSGTSVGFIMEHENLSYPDALKYLARKYGIEVREKEETAEEVMARQRSETLYAVTEYAEKFFVDSLSTDEGRTLGAAYFRSRGLEDETVRKYGLGWAPSDRTSLSGAAAAAGYREEYLIDTGLAVKYDDGRLADRFFSRVMFPIHSVSGRIIAFGGRTLRTDKSVAKYVNSPETEIYVKSNSLYGIYFAKNAIVRQDKCFLVEGYLDVLSMYQLGITNVVASSGTSLTQGQIRLIRKFTQNITIMYDGDSAGIHAALRGIGLVLKEGMNVKVVLIPDGDDPDSFARKHTLDEVTDFIESGERDFIEFKADLLLGEAGNDPLKKADLINDIADTIALMPDPVKRSVYTQMCAAKFDTDSGILFSRVRQTRDRMLEDEKKAALRAAERKDARQEDEPAEQETAEVDAETGRVIAEDPSLFPAERDLMWFILNHGLEELKFESDSEFFDPDNIYTVADFIRGVLDEDGGKMRNSLLQRVYDMYFSYYDSSPDMAQQDIVKAIMDGSDREAADFTASLTTEKYVLSIEKFRNAMTATSSALVRNVPKAILVYQSRRVLERMRSLQDRLKTEQDPQQQDGLLIDIQKLSQVRKKIEEKLGRVQ
ncbi:MAG: DNA primase [Candidatus Cryptobacteroides sp.]